MNARVLDQIGRHFSGEKKTFVVNELSSITLQHVMAESDYNLENTQMAILALAQGDLDKIVYFTKRAKMDFRDVILWAGSKR